MPTVVLHRIGIAVLLRKTPLDRFKLGVTACS
jgi:hypothetical protein